MSLITFSDKSSGSEVTPENMNEIKNVVNSNSNNSTQKRALIIGNSIAGQSAINIDAANRGILASNASIGAMQITLTAGNVAAMSLVQGNTVAIRTDPGHIHIADVTGISGEVVSIEKSLPFNASSGARALKVTSKTVGCIYPSFQSATVLGYIKALNALSLGCLDIVGVVGWTSRRLIDLVSLLPSYLAYYKPEIVFLHGIENDIGATSSAQIIDLLKAQADICRSFGATPVVAKCLPMSSVSSEPNITTWNAVNDFIETIGTVVNGARWIDVGTVYADPAAPTTPLSGWTDGTHPNAGKVIAIAQDVYNSISDLFDVPLADHLVFGTNKMLAGTGGTATNLQSGSTVATSFTISSPASFTTTTSKTVNDEQSIVSSIASTPGANTVNAYSNVTLSYLTPQSIVKASALVKINSASNLGAILVWVSSGSYNICQASPSNVLSELSGDADLELLFETPAFVVDSSLTDIRITVLIQPVSSAGSFSCDVVLKRVGFTPCGFNSLGIGQ